MYPSLLLPTTQLSGASRMKLVAICIYQIDFSAHALGNTVNENKLLIAIKKLARLEIVWCRWKISLKTDSCLCICILTSLPLVVPCCAPYDVNGLTPTGVPIRLPNTSSAFFLHLASYISGRSGMAGGTSRLTERTPSRNKRDWL